MAKARFYDMDTSLRAEALETVFRDAVQRSSGLGAKADLFSPEDSDELIDGAEEFVVEPALELGAEYRARGLGAHVGVLVLSVYEEDGSDRRLARLRETRAGTLLSLRVMPAAAQRVVDEVGERDRTMIVHKERGRI
ncbi:hypothetical protein ER308_08720 [Egibacter rhizosphaerae]|uniref:Uncharacterized protein n=1 Tax=Egibacter rhizosphaerae TaxID=1670831 RepID=A0A411YEH6_9ACTN|nr:hypothetical protein [Egibacter rhizosphaerae]QBI19625.1 hypothetical protein ER308_08720 [Egibacter rhizosphaerae]